ncbi:hypothetical protein H6G89_14700 [Oscillatoria sp. FACHB-1407]|uniref:hypothetical protein n=1 Tax=Oscillatoria sp. FACHB-1407 TaxID=2692847 RepID=UPI0016863FC8|nr:hypothetical protein [Oscillatoria sp. FACHB-1407]MBD2462295.1 hypothetical protein [Oscillatoria sp. FACHB-1407]
MLTAEEFRFARAIDLERLTGIDASCFAAWSKTRQISERNLEAIATALSMTKGEVLRGFELRRQDTQLATQVSSRLKELTAS